MPKTLAKSLEYPFDIDVLHRKKKAIKRELELQPILFEKRIAIMGGSTTAEVKDMLELFLLKVGIRPVFYESQYNLYYEEIMFDNPELKEFKPDVIYIHTTQLNINNCPESCDSSDNIQSKFETELNKFQSMWLRIKSEYACNIIQNNFEQPDFRQYGNLDFSDVHGKVNFIARLNAKLAEYAQTEKGFFINDINYLSAQLGLSVWHDKKFWYSYKYALGYDAIPALSHSVASIIKSIYGLSRKCLVLDLDNTLWGGVIGDDGPDQIKIGKESAIAEAYTAFQTYIQALKARGIILAVCSKNEMSNAVEGFKLTASPLMLSDFAAFYANWTAKHENIKAIASEINIGVDSLVFVDDNPAEREIVRTNMPEVAVPDVGSDVLRFIEVIDRSGYFEPVALSQDDLKRSDYYQLELQRKDVQSSFQDYSAYLASLEMRAEIKPFAAEYHTRITQLINKTNQFNLTTRRKTIEEVQRISADPQWLGLYGRLVDKFGDNGLITVVIGEVVADELHIESWLMSCRVIKREMELALFDTLMQYCQHRGMRALRGTYLKTAKNAMVASHYADLGFVPTGTELDGSSSWYCPVPNNYELKNKHIGIENE